MVGQAAVPLVAMLLVTGVAPSAPARDLRNLIPDAAVPSWHATDPPAEYDASTLSNFIDGGAEVYVQYGFRAAINQEYSRGDETVACTVYEMTDPQAAFGVFSYFRTPRKTPLPIGDGGAGADLQLAFWQERYFVVVETFSLSDAARDALAVFGQAISSRIGTHSTPPPILRRLPRGFSAGSERLLSRDLATNALRAVVPASALTADAETVLVEADFDRNGTGVRLLLMPFRSAGALDDAWRSLRVGLAADVACQPAAPPKEESSCVHDGRLLVIRRIADALVIASGAATREAAAALLDRVSP